MKYLNCTLETITCANTGSKPLLGLCLSGKFSGIFQRSFVPLMVRVLDTQRLIHINVGHNKK